MGGTRPISFDRTKIAAAQATIPPTDFVAAQYDVDYSVDTTDVLILLSTPRSGSTLLCELLRVNDVCLPHEYFQPAQYMPLLADRWGCVRDAALDEAGYVRALRRFRTYQNGWLGINLHGSHIQHYLRMEPHFGAARLHYVHLVRRDVIAQAVSYHIASQTRQWSSEFAAHAEPAYDYAQVQQRLQRIQHQNAFIQAFLLARGAEYQTIVYEDLVVNMESTLRRVPGVPQGQPLRANPMLQRQSGSRSAEWMRRFAQDWLAEQEPATSPRHRGRIVTHVRRLLSPRRKA